MSNIEMTIEVINNKFTIVNHINKLLEYIIIPTINIRNNSNESLPIVLDNNNIDILVDKYIKNKSSKDLLYFYKNTKYLLEKIGDYNDMYNFYNSDIIYYTANYYTYKNKQLELNKISLNDNKYSKDISFLYDYLNIFISSNNFHNKLDNYFKLVNEYITVYVNDKYLKDTKNIHTDKFLVDELKYDDIGLSNFISSITSLSTYTKILNKIKELINSYNKLYNKEELCKDKYDVCGNCNIKMVVKINTSELICQKCGNIITLIGTVLDDNHLYSQEGQKFKHGSYNPMRHCKSWIESIQAKDKSLISEDIINKIRDKIKKNRIINVNNITIDQYRKYLKELKLTSYNNNITLIRKQITGISPPQLSHDETTMLYNYFDKSIKTYNLIKSKDKRNSLFFPYFIFKCLELIVKDPNKKKELLNCIHLQEKNTLIDNDKYWHQICTINKFTFITTDRSKYI